MPKLTNAQRLQESLKRERAKRQELERALKESSVQQAAPDGDEAEEPGRFLAEKGGA